MPCGTALKLRNILHVHALRQENGEAGEVSVTDDKELYCRKATRAEQTEGVADRGSRGAVT